MHQYDLGIERELTDFSLQVQYIRRNFRNFIGFVDTGSLYEPVQRRDPGVDGRLGTADDGSFVTVYNKVNPGNEFFLFTNPPGAFRRYSALQVIAQKRYSRNWQLLAAYTWSRTEGSVNNELGSNVGWGDVGQNGSFTNPNRAINATGRAAFDVPHEVKVFGTYRVPFWQGFNLSAAYRYHTGLAWGRVATVGGLRQGVERVRIEPRGTRRVPAINNLDLRVEKTFRLGNRSSRTLGILADVFNVTNRGVPNSRYGIAVVEFSGPNFGMPNVWVAPRTLQAGIRFTF